MLLMASLPCLVTYTILILYYTMTRVELLYKPTRLLNLNGQNLSHEMAVVLASSAISRAGFIIIFPFFSSLVTYLGMYLYTMEGKLGSYMPRIPTSSGSKQASKRTCSNPGVFSRSLARSQGSPARPGMLEPAFPYLRNQQPSITHIHTHTLFFA